MNDQNCPRYQLISPIADSLSSPKEVDISIRDIVQKEPTKSPNISERTNLSKKSAGTLGNKSIDLVIVLMTMISDMTNTREEGQRIKINSPLSHPLNSKEEL